MMPQKSLTLLERKRLQWEREKEELIGLCAPWGRPPSLKLSNSCTSLTEGIKNLSTNLDRYGGGALGNKNGSSSRLPLDSSAFVSSNYLEELGLVGSQSEYHLPPIGLEKQKGHETEVHRDGNGSLMTKSIGNGPELNYWFNRKRSLPSSCILTPSGELSGNTQYRNFGQPETLHRNFYHAKERSLVNQIEDKGQRHSIQRHKLSPPEKWKQQYFDEDPHTSGYQSENPFHSDGSGESRNGTADADKNPQLLRRYTSNGNNLQDRANMNLMQHGQESYVYTSEVDYQANNNGWTKPGSYLYSKRNEMDHYEVHQHESGTRNVTTKSTQAESLQQKTWSYVNSRIHIPPPAMRSSFTTSLDAPDKDAYQDLKKQEHDKWLRDLEQQREEQRLRKQMEKDEKTGRWGDRGVVVGHLWEPASVPDARLPPREERGDANFTGSISGSGSPREVTENHPPRWWSEAAELARDDDEMASSAFPEENDRMSYVTEMSERQQKMQKALQHQEAIRKQIEERQQKLKEAHEKRIAEENAEEAKILAYRLEQLKKLESTQRQELIREQEKVEPQQNGSSMFAEKQFEDERINLFASKNRGDIDTFYRQLQIENSYLLRKNLATTFTLPLINPSQQPLEGTTGTSSPYRHRSISPFEEYEATVIKEETFSTSRVRTDTSQSTGSTRQEFGTQTEDGASVFEPVLNEEPSHNEISADADSSTAQLTGPSVPKTMKKLQTKKKERPKWGIPQPTKQYMKQSEKDPHYQHRLQRRLDRQKRRENQLKCKAAMLETKSSTEVEDLTSTANPKSFSNEDSKSLGSGQEEPPKIKMNSKRARLPKMKVQPNRKVRNVKHEKMVDDDVQETVNNTVQLEKLEVTESRKVSAQAIEIVQTHQRERDAEKERNDIDMEMKVRNFKTIEANANEVDVNPEVEDRRVTNSPPVPALMKKLEQEQVKQIEQNNDVIAAEAEPALRGRRDSLDIRVKKKLSNVEVGDFEEKCAALEKTHENQNGNNSNDVEVFTVDSIQLQRNNAIDMMTKRKLSSIAAFEQKLASLDIPEVKQNDDDPNSTNPSRRNSFERVRTKLSSIAAFGDNLTKSDMEHSKVKQNGDDKKVVNDAEECQSRGHPFDRNLKSKISSVAAFEEKLADLRDSESELVPKMAPATLIIESSADYFSGSEKPMTSDMSTPNLVPISPPNHLKRLIFGIQDLGNYLPLNSDLESGTTNSTEHQTLNSELTQGALRNRTIEFTIKFPSDYYHQEESLLFHEELDDEGEWHNTQNFKTRTSGKTEEFEYLDPYLHDKKRSTIDWLHAENVGSRHDSTLNHLLAMRKGIRNQQEEWGVVPSDSEMDGSIYASSFYPSSDRSSSSN